MFLEVRFPYCVLIQRHALQDRVGALVIDEAIATYVACSYLLLPSSKVLVQRLANLLADEQRNWTLLALLKSFAKMENVCTRQVECRLRKLV